MDSNQSGSTSNIKITIRFPSDLVALIDQKVSENRMVSRSEYIRQAVYDTIFKIDHQGLDHIFPENRIKYFNEILETPFAQYSLGVTNFEQLVKHSVEREIGNLAADLEQTQLINFFVEIYGREGMIRYHIFNLLTGHYKISQPTKKNIINIIPKTVRGLPDHFIMGKITSDEIEDNLQKMKTEDLVETYKHVIDVIHDEDGNVAQIFAEDEYWKATSKGENLFIQQMVDFDERPIDHDFRKTK